MTLGQIKRELQSLYTGKATVYVYEYVTGENKRQTKTKTILHEDIPCRLSYDRKVNTEQDTHGTIVQDITMHCSPEYTIPAGSVIDITQNGISRTFSCASDPAVYESHQEVELTAYRKKA